MLIGTRSQFALATSARERPTAALTQPTTADQNDRQMNHGMVNIGNRYLTFRHDPLRRSRHQSARLSRITKQQRNALVLMVPALLWVLTQLVMSGFITLSPQALANGLQTITICSGNALTTITVDANGQPVEDIPPKTIKCPWCTHLGGSGVLPPPDPVQLLRSFREVCNLEIPQKSIFASAALFFNYITRAPPLSASL